MYRQPSSFHCLAARLITEQGGIANDLSDMWKHGPDLGGRVLS